MTGDRVKQVRQAKDLNQEDFGARINVSKFAISNYELNKRPVTDRVISDICREYGVNEDWLRTGQGDMFLPTGVDLEFEQVWAQIAKSKNDNADFIKRIMRAFWSLSEDKQAAVKEFIEKMSEK